MPSPVPIDFGITGPVTGGDNFTATITMDQVVTSDTVVNLSRDNPNVVVGPLVGPSHTAFPRSVTVAQGQSSVAVQFGTQTVTTSTTVTLTASANGGSANGTVTVNP